MDPDDPTLGFDAIFTKDNNTTTSPSLPPHGNEVIENVDNYRNDITGSEGVPEFMTPLIVSFDRSTASEGDLLFPDASNKDSERDISRMRDYGNSKVKVRFNDSVTSMSGFTNVCECVLSRSKFLQEGKLTYNIDGIVYNLFTNFSAE